MNIRFRGKKGAVDDPYGLSPLLSVTGMMRRVGIANIRSFYRAIDDGRLPQPAIKGRGQGSASFWDRWSVEALLLYGDVERAPDAIRQIAARREALASVGLLPIGRAEAKAAAAESEAA